LEALLGEFDGRSLFGITDKSSETFVYQSSKIWVRRERIHPEMREQTPLVHFGLPEVD
jgi:hypothetical protein